MATTIGIHGVTRIELSAAYPANGNSRTLRIVSTAWEGHEVAFELTVYGNTYALDAIPRAKDFRLTRENPDDALEAAFPA